VTTTTPRPLPSNSLSFKLVNLTISFVIERISIPSKLIALQHV
jgi:hypothetical protein